MITRLMGLLCVVLIVLGATLTPVSASSDTATITVYVAPSSGGTLEATIQSWQFESISAEDDERVLTGSLAVRVFDTRGIGSGWVVSISAGPWMHRATTSVPDSGANLALGASTIAWSSLGTYGIETSAISSVTEQSLPLIAACAGAGWGEFILTTPGEFRLAQTDAAGEYFTQLTLQIALPDGTVAFEQTTDFAITIPSGW